MKKLFVLLVLFFAVSCSTESVETERSQAINQRTVNFLDRAEAGLKPCLDLLKNENSTDMAIASACVQAVSLYRRYGGRDYLAPLPLTLIKESDKVRVSKLLDNLDYIESRYLYIERKNADNFYFNQVLDSQKFADKTVNAYRHVDEADAVSKPQEPTNAQSIKEDDSTDSETGGEGHADSAIQPLAECKVCREEAQTKN